MRALMGFGALLAALPICRLSASAADAFSKPSGQPYGNFAVNPVYRVDEEIDVEWETELDRMDLLLSRVLLNGPGLSNQGQWVVKSDTEDKHFTWKTGDRAQYLGHASDDQDAVFYFSVSYVGANTTRFREASHYFNITTSDNHSTSSSDPTTHNEIGASSIAAKSSSALSKGSIAAIIVAAIVISFLVLGGLAFLLWRRSRRDETRLGFRLSATSSRQSGPVLEKNSEETEHTESRWISELATDDKDIAELPSTCWTHFTAELPSNCGVRRSGDSWDANEDEQLDIIEPSPPPYDSVPYHAGITSYTEKAGPIN